MLLYSTLLETNDTLTKEKFLNLLVKWNKEQKYEENIVPEFLDWDGSRNKRYGTDDLWIEIQEYRNGNTIAVRYENLQNNGAIWDTDYVVNFDEKKIAIQLNRSFLSGSESKNQEFSAPNFVRYLIHGGFLKPDHGLKITDQEHVIEKDNLNLLVAVVNRTAEYRLPVIYVSKTKYNTDPVEIDELCHQVKGVAHVLVESDISLNQEIQSICGNEDMVYNGNIGVYFSDVPPEKVFLQSVYHGKPLLSIKAVDYVYHYSKVQTTPKLYTWEEVKRSILQDRYADKRKEFEDAVLKVTNDENELKDFLDSYTKDMDKYQEQINRLTDDLDNYKRENQWLHGRLDQTGTPLLYYGEEKDLYPEEIKEMILDAIKEELKRSGSDLNNCRYSLLLNDVLQSNGYKGTRKKRKEQIRKLLNGYKRMDEKVQRELENFGFAIKSEKNHYKLIYYGDSRYEKTLSKTGSDSRGGSNAASEIIHRML